MKIMYVYMLLCSDDSYYVGVTNDIERRLIEHNSGLDPKAYTFRKTPVKLVWHESFIDPNEAIDFEKQLKGWNRKKKEALIEGNWNRIKEVSNEKNDRKK